MEKRRLHLAVMMETLICLLALSACGNVVSGNGQSSDSSSKNSSASQSKDSIDKSEEAASTGEMEGAGNLGDYYVEIKGGTVGEDYGGNPVAIITYAWTNNSNETTSAMLSISEKAFQNGVELEGAYFVDSDIYESNASKDVRPGTTIDIQCAFVLENQTSDVEIELSELFDFSKKSPKVVKIFSFE